MSKVLLGQKISEERYDPRIIHNKPEQLNEEQMEQGIEVDNDAIPEKPETKRGETTSLFVNPQTKEVWWEVQEGELSNNERLEVLEEKVDKILKLLQNE